MGKAAATARLCAAIYLVLVLACAGWALYADLYVRYTQQEHLLASTVLFGATLPSSLAVGAVFTVWPEMFFGALIEDVCLSLCGLLQASLLFHLANRIELARLRSMRPSRMSEMHVSNETFQPDR